MASNRTIRIPIKTTIYYVDFKAKQVVNKKVVYNFPKVSVVEVNKKR